MRRALLPLTLLALTLPACDSDDPGDEPDPGDLELITRVEVTLASTVDPEDVVTLIAIDEDGDGVGIEYQPVRASLAPGVTYAGTIRLTDEPNDRNVTDEIELEADQHRFAYSSTVDGLSIVVTDSESDYLEDQGFEDYEVGLTFDVAVSAEASGSGTLGVVLYHFDEPKESSEDTSDEIDVELAFPISVE